MPRVVKPRNGTPPLWQEGARTKRRIGLTHFSVNYQSFVFGLSISLGSPSNVWTLTYLNIF